MRTTIELRDDLLAEAQRHSKAKSKRALVEEALAAFVAMKAGEHRCSTYRERLVSLRRRTKALRLRSDARNILRKDRDSR